MKKTAQKSKETIHYHRDTEEICNSLNKNSAYKTSKGHAIFVGRSQSNGKIQFKYTDNNKNIYFTKKEWNDGQNSPKNIDKDYIRKAETAAEDKYTSFVADFVKDKTRLLDVSGESWSGQEAVYKGFDMLNGIKVEYQDGVKSIVYFGRREFRSRFEIIETKKVA